MGIQISTSQLQISVKKMRNYLKIYIFFLIATILVVAHPQPQGDDITEDELIGRVASPSTLEEMNYENMVIVQEAGRLKVMFATFHPVMVFCWRNLEKVKIQ